MFRSKRSALVRRLWKCRAGCDNNNDDGEPGETEADLELKTTSQSIFKRLKDRQLELLVQALESKGGAISSCVLLAKGDLRLGRRTVCPRVVLCQLFRWPDLRHSYELKPLTFCCDHARNQGNDDSLICCNPFHLSRVCGPESPPPPYSQLPMDTYQLEAPDTGPQESTETGASNTAFTHHNYTDLKDSHCASQPIHWCNVAYWELRSRVGRLYQVNHQSANIFQELPHGDGLCLGLLDRECRTESVIRTRTKIGYGVTISREQDGVWAYNRSNHAMFVNSPTLDTPNSRTLSVWKVSPGYSIRIFDYEKSELLRRTRNPELMDGPYDPNSVRISFVKGWGPCYSRQFVTSCPCWIEIIFNLPR
ncbi:SMAD family member 6 [Saccoglossus kowalevskii]|uniref:Mothers against decapentaplegic homolog n=1 Tax=Saccoglossus kowalevskii TaxID=10224 RepID=B5LVZ2_SACKO|nr:SMAD family member 6 [Saccoglossus kowalevskii]ACG76365.1 Smad6 protein [Saccoglossus kowalevskii]